METRFAESLYGDLSKSALNALKQLLRLHKLSVTNADIKVFRTTIFKPAPRELHLPTSKR